MIRRLFNWYFSRNTLPYWCIVALDLLLCFMGGLFVMWLRHPLSSLLESGTLLCHTFVAYMVLNAIGFRVFHTYSGILRYSQFVDLMRVIYSGVLSLVVALLFNHFVVPHLPGVFYELTGRMTVFLFVVTTALMCGMRILIKLVFDNALVSHSAPEALIYGTHAGAIALTNEVRNTKPVRFLIEGYIGDEQAHYRERLMGKRIWSVHEDLRSVIAHKGIKAVLVSPLKHEQFVRNRALQDLLMDMGVKIYVTQNAEEWAGRASSDKPVRIREVKIEDLLPREEIQVDMEGVGSLLRGRKVLITGSAGSIGSELVRQIAGFAPGEMMLIDQAETPQHDIRLMMKEQYNGITAHTLVTSICNEPRMEAVFRGFRPDYVFHAAAYKHVPMMEDNPCESIENNVWGTKVIADLSVKYGVKKFVMISTDKAVNPTNVMGCSKRICEIYVQSLDKALKSGAVEGITQFVTTRFGNVLGSNGSVIPLFRKQLEHGGPLTVTHPDIIRYFMLIPEACKLVLEAGTHGHGGEIFVFDMGEPVKIADLARRMIMLSGATNVEIKFTGLRDGEKLYEEVLGKDEDTKPSFHKKIRIATVRSYDYADVLKAVEELRATARKYDDMATVQKMKEMVPEYKSRHSPYEVLDR